MQFVNNLEVLPIIYGDYPVKIHHDFKFGPNELAIRMHYHDRFEMLLIKQGSLECYYSNEHVTYKAGELAIISPKLLHSAFAGSDGVVYDVIIFNIDHFFNHTAASKNFLTPLNDGNIIFEFKTTHPDIINLVRTIVEGDLNRDANQPLTILGYVYTLMGTLYTHCATAEKSATNIEEKFGKVISYINKHFNEDISSSFLSSKFGYEEAYFCRKFKKNTGITVMKYIQVLRLEEAKKLISKSNSSIKDIALSCGFSDVAYFTNCFKRLYQITPTQIRESKNYNNK